jgi:hypothetical protein
MRAGSRALGMEAFLAERDYRTCCSQLRNPMRQDTILRVPWHGRIVGSIPTRSTNSLNNLGKATIQLDFKSSQQTNVYGPRFAGVHGS